MHLGILNFSVIEYNSWLIEQYKVKLNLILAWRMSKEYTLYWERIEIKAAIIPDLSGPVKLIKIIYFLILI
jgi:C4-dicarboxylate transporter